MQIVIDISEGAYNYIKANGARIPYHKLIDVIKEGAPLPKGHGRLIDADELKKVINQFDYYDQVSDAPTILEADKE